LTPFFVFVGTPQIKSENKNKKVSFMTKKNNKISSINSFCSSEQLVKFVGKLCIFNLTFMSQGVTGRVKEVNDNFILLEMRDGRLLCARIDSVLGFAMAKNQYTEAV